jgi:uncharacterized protein (TIGR02145 family)
MKKIIVAAIGLFSLAALNGQAVEQGLPVAEEISNRRTSFNMEEIKVRWKKAALENCPGVPCAGGTGGSFTCGTSTVADIDGNTYNTVLIGTQCWTKSNLKVTKYNDGTLIPLDATGGVGPTNGTSSIWNNLTSGTYCIFGNEPSTGTNATNYGFMYNWYAVKGIATPGSTSYKNLCPTGWHVPTDGEWTSLLQFIDPAALPTSNPSSRKSNIAGGKLRSTSNLWNAGGTSTDNFGFSALPGGYRDVSGGYFNSDRTYAQFWSSTDHSSGVFAWSFSIYYNDSGVDAYLNEGKTVGNSVRCLKD